MFKSRLDLSFAIAPLSFKSLTCVTPEELALPVLFIMLPSTFIVRIVVIKEFSFPMTHVLEEIAHISTTIVLVNHGALPLALLSSLALLPYPVPGVVIAGRPGILAFPTGVVSLKRRIVRPGHLSFDFPAVNPGAREI